MSSPAMRQVAACNSFAVRVALLATGLVGQWAVAPLVSAPMRGLCAVGLVAASAFSLRVPLAGAAGRGLRWRPQGRQVVALALIVVAAVEGCLRLGSGVEDAQSALAEVLLMLQIAVALAGTTRSEAGLGAVVVVAMFVVAGVFVDDVALLAPLVFGLAGVCVVATLLRRAALLAAADGIAVGSETSVLRAALGPMAVAAAVGVLIFLALPKPDAAHGRFGSAAATHGGHAASRATGGLAGGTTLDLRSRGALPTQPVFSVPAAAPLYWQGTIYDTFDGLRWTSPASGALVAWPAAPDGGQIVQTRPGASSAGERSDAVEVLGGGAWDVVLAPGVATAYTGPGRVGTDADGVARIIAGVVAAPDRYTVESTRVAATPERLRAATGADLTDPTWLQTPSTLTARVSGLARQLATGNRYTTVEAIENYLRAHEKYDLNSPLPRQGDGAVDDFVFVSHRGFCEQFATAAVVMLRSVGIPARVVTGFQGGDASVEAGRRVFLGSDAHAWVQVHYPGVGWVDSDPTAGAALAKSTPSFSQRVANALHALWRSVPGGRAGAFVITAGCLAVGLLLARGWRVWRRGWREWWRGWWRRRRPRKRGRGVGVAPEGSALAAFLRLEQALADGDRRRADGETLAEFARRLGGIVVSPGEVAAAIRCVERECYAEGRRRPNQAEVDAAVAVFERLRAAAGNEVVALARADA